MISQQWYKIDIIFENEYIIFTGKFCVDENNLITEFYDDKLLNKNILIPISHGITQTNTTYDNN